jgi:hypothetical protein
MKRDWSEMRYDRGFHRWLVVLGGKEYTLHCGEWFDLSFGETSVPCRLELDGQWYVVMRGIRFYLYPKEKYMVEV